MNMFVPCKVYQVGTQQEKSIDPKYQPKVPTQVCTPRYVVYKSCVFFKKKRVLNYCIFHKLELLFRGTTNIWYLFFLDLGSSVGFLCRGSF